MTIKKERKRKMVFFRHKKDDILAYLIKNSEENDDPIYPDEIIDHFGISSKQLSGYLCDLEREGYVQRPDDISPKPIFVTEKGKKAFYNRILTVFPEDVQEKIKKDLNN